MWLKDLERRDEVLRISRPVEVELEAGCIADRLVKSGGPAVVFEKPVLPDGTISQIPLVMNLFGTEERTKRALGAKYVAEIGERLVAMMKPDIGLFIKRPWKAIPLLKDAMSLPPKKVRRAACQQIIIKDPDVTKLPIPKTWPLDGGQFITLPLVVTKDSQSGEHNLGMYRSQIFSPKKIGLHWQIHKHAADHAAEHTSDTANTANTAKHTAEHTAEHADFHEKDEKKSSRSNPAGTMPVAICIGGPPELIFSAITPLPDNLEEYMFAGFLAKRRLRITKAKTQDLWIPAEVDIVIEGYCDPNERQNEGPFGDHFGHYSLEGDYPVLHITAITMRKNAVLPATIVGIPPMEDGYLGEAVGDALLPVLKFQHRDIRGLYLPLETGFHNLAIMASHQRYPRQARKTALGLLGAGQLMFLKVIVAVDEGHRVKNLDLLLTALHSKVSITNDLQVLDGQVADSLAHSAPYENIHSKLIIDATTPAKADHLKEQSTSSISQKLLAKVEEIPNVNQARLLKPSIMVITTKIPNSPNSRVNTEESDNASAANQRTHINELIKTIWQLDNSKDIRWLFITDDDLNLNSKDAKRILLWQLFCRFEVSRDLHFDSEKARVAWDATSPIPCDENSGGDGEVNLPVRRWPAITLHDPEIEKRVDEMAEEEGWPWKTIPKK